MRRCPCCGEFTSHDEFVCHHCQYGDIGWADNLISSHHRSGTGKRKSQPTQQLSLQFGGASLPASVEYPEILVSPMGDTGEFGFHLARIQTLKARNPNHIVRVYLNFCEWAYCWDYGDETDPNLDVYLPPNVPIPAIVEVARLIHTLRSYEDIGIRITLPHKGHPVSQFLLESGVFSAIPVSSLAFPNHPLNNHGNPGCDNVLVPLTYIGTETQGQLSTEFHVRFNELLFAGVVQSSYRFPLRDIVMEAAANADQYGGGGWVIAFLRQEKRGAQNFGHRNQMNFSAVAETHLYLHVFSIGSTLAETTGLPSEWEAANAVVEGYSTRQSGGGLGMPRIVEFVTATTQGTVYISSGGYSRLITPDGLAREFSSAGSLYLPGVHLCAVIPLAVISEIPAASQSAF